MASQLDDLKDIVKNLAARLDKSERERAQLAEMFQRKAKDNVDDVRAVAGKPRKYRVRNLTDGVTYTLEDDGVDVDGHGVFVRDHGRRQALIASLDEVREVDGKRYPVWAFVERYEPRYIGDPLARATHVDDPAAKAAAEVLGDMRKAQSRKILDRIQPEVHTIRTEMRAAKEAAGAQGGATA